MNFRHRCFAVLPLYLTCQLAVVVVLAHACHAQSFETRNAAVYIGHKTWRWTVFVVGNEGQMARVREVKYKLWPLGKRAIETQMRKRGEPCCFPHTESGWGTFRIPITIEFNDGSKELKLSHELAFTYNEPPVVPALRVTLEKKDATKGWTEWHLQLDGTREELAQVQCVQWLVDEQKDWDAHEVCTDAPPSQPLGYQSVSLTIPRKVLTRVFLRSGEFHQFEDFTVK